MKTDRELLELAARAARYKVRWHDVWQCLVHELPINTDNPPTFAGQRLVWVPLQDDGDAQRLRNKLRMDVFYTDQGINVARDDVLLAFETWGANDLATERRAITRAAAQMQLNKEKANG